MYGRLESIRGSFCIFLVFRKDTITFHPCQVKLCWSVVFNTLIQRQSDLCLFLWLQAQIFKAFRGETSSSLSFICLFLFLLRDLLLNRGTVPLPMATRSNFQSFKSQHFFLHFQVCLFLISDLLLHKDAVDALIKT